MASTNTFQKAINMASKPGAYLGIIHKSDGNTEFKALKQDTLVPQRLIELQSKAGLAVDTRDSQIFITPSADKIEYIENSNIRVINYIEGFTQAVTPLEAKNFYQLLSIIDSYQVMRTVSMPVILMDVIELDESAETNLHLMNMGLSAENGFSVDYTLEDAQAFMNLKRDLLENYDDLYHDCRIAIIQYAENASVNSQSLTESYIYLEAEKSGKGLLGSILDSKSKFTQILFAVGLIVAIIFQQIFSNT